VPVLQVLAVPTNSADNLPTGAVDLALVQLVRLGTGAPRVAPLSHA
jgi:hypothetical protein